MHAPSLPSPPPTEFPGPRDVDVVDTTTAASSLPTDVLLEIFLRLEESTNVICCACVCKPWRRAIIGNAASLRPRPGRFDPRLLLGVFHFSRYEARLLRERGSFESALPSNGVGRLGGYETVGSLIPAAAGRGLYRELLWSADGFILLMARTVNRLCLFNPITGDCTFLPGAAASRCSAYFLLTGYDDDAASASRPGGTGNKLAAVRILAVQKRHRYMLSTEGGLSYQVLMLTHGAGDDDSAGVWGPVQRYAAGDESEVVPMEADEQGGGLCVWMERRSTLVCRDAVYWLAGPSVVSVTCTLALDVRTGRTWTTELPRHYRRLHSLAYRDPDCSLPILVTSGDGRPSLMELLRGPRIQVWVMLNGGGDDDARCRWTPHRTIPFDVGNLLPPDWPADDDELTFYIKEMVASDLSLSAFCPRSGCVVGVCCGWELLIDIHSGWHPLLVRRIGRRRRIHCFPYELDCSSTYISKMKHF